MAKRQLESNTHISPKNLLRFVVAFLLFFLLLISVLRIAGKYFTNRRHIQDLQRQEATLRSKATTLKETNDYLTTSEGQEQALRDKYNVLRPGEGMIIVTTEEAGRDTEQHPSSKVSQWWDSILRGLGIRK